MVAELDIPDAMESLLDGPAAAVLTTYRRDGSALASPVWFRVSAGAFEVVIARGDVKLRHLGRDQRCTLVTVRPFRGIEARGEAELVDCDVAEARVENAGRYLGSADGARFAAARAGKPGILVRLVPTHFRAWDLSGILPA